LQPVVEPTSTPAPVAAAQKPTLAPPKPTTLPTRAATVAASPTLAPSSTPGPHPTQPAVAPSGKSVVLTFDAGSDRGYAEDILDRLQEENVVASFGITGVWAKANPDLVRRMAADGHLVFNHTLDHRSFTGVSDKLGGLSAARRRAELDDADTILTPLLGHSTKPFYRLPYGDDDARVAADVLPTGYSHKVGWTIDSLGWQGAQSADIVARCLRLAAPGAIYVFHVGRASQDSIALPQTIHGLRDKGFSFRRVDQG
jgi:peptidoglycan/xylan/chitin deacetylase (PgdA/CDA1 family)